MTEDILKELTNRILLIDRNVDNTAFEQSIYMILHDYKIEKATYDLEIYKGDVNQKILRKYIIAKTVQGLSERSIELYKHDVQNFMDFINKPVTQTTVDDIRYFFAVLSIQKKVSRTYQINRWRTLSAFYTWMLKEELIEKNPFFKIECPKKIKKKENAFTEIEVETMRNSLASADARDKALFEVMLSTWCRVTEISNMNIKDIEGDCINVMGKGSKMRKVYLNTKARIALENYLKTRTDNNEALFITKDKPKIRLKVSGIEIWCRKKLGEKNNIEKVHPHRFRRTGATFALRAGMPIQDVSRLLGHESIETTQIYLDIDEKEIARSHEKYVH